MKNMQIYENMQNMEAAVQSYSQKTIYLKSRSDLGGGKKSRNFLNTVVRMRMKKEVHHWKNIK